MRIVIGEDSALFREGLARLLEDAGHEVVGRAADATTLVEVVERERPDLAIIDVRMPPDGTDDGARAAKELRNRMPELAIVLLSQHVETRHSVELVVRRPVRLPAQGPGLRRRRLHGRAAPGGGRRFGARPRGGRDAARPAARPTTRWRC